MNFALSAILYLISLLFLVILYNCNRYKNIKGAKAFSFMVIALFFNSFGYASELLSTTLDGMLFWIRIEYIGIAFIPFTVIYFMREYTDEKKLVSNQLLFVIFSLNFITMILTWTNNYHCLYYKTVGVDLSHDFPVLMFERGIAYYVQGAVLFFALFYSIVLLIKRAVELNGSYRKRNMIMVVGLMMPGLTAVYYFLGFGPDYIDVTTFSFFLLSIMILFGLFRYNVTFFSHVTHEMIFNTIEEAVLVVDKEEYVVRLNTVAKKYFNELRDMSVGKNLKEYPFVRSLLHGEAYQVIEKEKRYFQIRNIEMKATYGSVLVFTDITESHTAKLKLEELAIRDYLTGLYNRRYVVEQFSKVEEEGMMCLIDVDYFKKINDKFGHIEGDRVLIELSKLLQNMLPKATICRYGGEEFLLYQTGISLEVGLDLIESFRQKVAESKGEITYTISAGICMYQQKEFVDSVNRADKLLYEAKKAGRNQVKFE